MRIITCIFLLLLFLASCKSGDNKAIDPSDSTKFTTVQWLDSLVDFGTITEGQKANIQFRFQNTGTKPLIVASVVATCGCTVPEYSREPVSPGEEGFVKAIFNSENQPPTVHKTIHVAMNTKEQSYGLSFMGNVKKETN